MWCPDPIASGSCTPITPGVSGGPSSVTGDADCAALGGCCHLPNGSHQLLTLLRALLASRECIPAPSQGCPPCLRGGAKASLNLQYFCPLKNTKLQAALISFTEVTTEAPAVYVQRIFLNFLIFQKFIPLCLNQREENWASWHLSQPLH